MAKTYVLVGATSGIGQQVAAALSGRNATVHALGRRGGQAEDLPGAAQACCDVTVENPTFPQIETPIDGLAYFPGTINLKPFHLLRRKDFLQDLEVNYLGAVKTIQNYLPQLKKADASSVVLMSTVAVQTGLAFHASIAGAKGAIEGLTRALAAELAPKIRRMFAERGPRSRRCCIQVAVPPACVPKPVRLRRASSAPEPTSLSRSGR
jgi:3-oxoacyl-[acyl-carrier protein] reductase